MRARGRSPSLSLSLHEHDEVFVSAAVGLTPSQQHINTTHNTHDKQKLLWTAPPEGRRAAVQILPSGACDRISDINSAASLLTRKRRK